MDLKSLFKFLFPEYQIYKTVKVHGFIKRFSGTTVSHRISKIIAVLYFIIFMLLAMFLFIAWPLRFMSEIVATIGSGFSQSSNAIVLFYCSFIIAFSMLIPPLRIMYYKLPWLMPFIKIFFMNTIIMFIGISILNYGYEVQNGNRHTAAIIIMIAQLVICRFIICLHFNKNRAEYLLPFFLNIEKKKISKSSPFVTFGVFALIVAIVAVVLTGKTPNQSPDIDEAISAGYSEVLKTPRLWTDLIRTLSYGINNKTSSIYFSHIDKNDIKC